MTETMLLCPCQSPGWGHFVRAYYCCSVKKKVNTVDIVFDIQYKGILKWHIQEISKKCKTRLSKKKSNVPTVQEKKMYLQDFKGEK